MLLSGSLSAVPCRIEVVVKMAHGNAKLRNIVIWLAGNLGDRAVKLFFCFSQMNQNGFVVHNSISLPDVQELSYSHRSLTHAWIDDNQVSFVGRN